VNFGEVGACIKTSVLPDPPNQSALNPSKINAFESTSSKRLGFAESLDEILSSFNIFFTVSSFNFPAIFSSRFDLEELLS